MDAFGVSTQQASLDLNAYIEQAKRNLVYDRSLRTYLRGKHFKPKYLKPDAEEYFAQLRAVDQGLVSAEQMREYVEKVTAKMGDNGASTTSTVAKPNNMGGTSANIAKGGTADTKGTAGGLASNKPQVMNTKNVNVVGAKGATKMSSQPGHGAEKKGKPETAANTKSIVGK